MAGHMKSPCGPHAARGLDSTGLESAAERATVKKCFQILHLSHPRTAFNRPTVSKK